ncbi:hypothetical protein L6452_28132 [Arctium lappa]|uniref:Uncharacterized protein n=1 Tax=Arctium lappa TaxID=4217 RepID=A0ACB8ZXG0_ARCLA|nr:hypothetical protein L6452_28132 [Arctium lappa]
MEKMIVPLKKTTWYSALVEKTMRTYVEDAMTLRREEKTRPEQNKSVGLEPRRKLNDIRAWKKARRTVEERWNWKPQTT